MIIFPVRQGHFGQCGWRGVPFWLVWLPAWLGGRVTRVVVGSETSIGEMAAKGYNWFDKRVARDHLHALCMLDASLDLKELPKSDLVEAYRMEARDG